MPVNVKGILFAAAAVGAALVLARARSALPALAKPASGRSAQDTPYARIDAYVQGQTARLNLPGAALAIVEGDEIAHLRTFGKAHPGGEAPTPQTPYFIGSLTKSFTALAAGAEQSPWPRPWLLDITLPVALNLVLVASALGLLATDLRPTLRLFMPDLFWLIVISGGFALVWSAVRTRLILQVSRGDA